jgi:hypothetical protein
MGYGTDLSRKWLSLYSRQRYRTVCTVTKSRAQLTPTATTVQVLHVVYHHSIFIDCADHPLRASLILCGLSHLRFLQ